MKRLLALVLVASTLVGACNRVNDEDGGDTSQDRCYPPDESTPDDTVFSFCGTPFADHPDTLDGANKFYEKACTAKPADGCLDACDAEAIDKVVMDEIGRTHPDCVDEITQFTPLCGPMLDAPASECCYVAYYYANCPPDDSKP